MNKQDGTNLVESFVEFKEFKNIDRESLMRILEDIFRHMIIKKYGTDENFDIIVNVDKGDLEIWRNRSIVEDNELEDNNLQISHSDAIKIEPDFEIGESVVESIKLSDFGRREIMALRQHLITKVKDLEKSNIYRKYKDKIGEIIMGEVSQERKNELLIVDDDNMELSLPSNEQIRGDRYKKGDYVKAIVSNIEIRKGNPIITLSRTSPDFLERLLESEIPEIYDGLITIKNIVRMPGEKAKISVETYDERIDPVGACVGIRGNRIHGIVKELNNENIDVINYSENIELYIQRSLRPAKTSSMEIDYKNKQVSVFMDPEQISVAIGKNGHNIKLASKLTGYEIDIYSNADYNYEDVDLQEFNDEIEQWIIDDLVSIGCDTARSVLALSVEDLVTRSQLEEETILEVIKILEAEFE